jgi:hypothetical protein
MISGLTRLALLALSCFALSVGPAAAAVRTFVASYGSDTNPCTVAAPCRSFSAAIAQTSFAGEVIVLDSAGYGPVTITKSVSLLAAPGVYAGISVFTGQNGILVNAGAGDKVVLRGLAINGQGGGIGIAVGMSGEVHIESCIISGMAAQGILVTLGSYTRIVHTTIRSNGMDGIYFTGAGALLVEDTTIVRNTRHGIWMNDGTNAVIRRVRVGDNVFEGLFVQQTTGTGTVAVSDGDFTNNQIGVRLWAMPPGAFLGVSIDRISANLNFASGVEVIGNSPSNVNATINASQTAFNGSYGIASSGSGVALVTINRSAADQNGSVGVYASGGAGVVVGINDNSIARNGVNDIQQFSPAIVRTFGTNALSGFASDVSGSLTGASRY